MPALTGINAESTALRWRGLGLALLAGLVLGTWLYSTPAGLLGKADAIGYAVCHRIELRSFHLGDRALPLCSRCSGMYLGAMLGFLYYFASGRGRSGLLPSRGFMAVFAAFGMAFTFDGINSYLHFFPNAPHLYEPRNSLRLVTGTLVGLGLATLVLAGFNQVAWRHWRREPALRSAHDLGWLVLLAAGLIVSILSEHPWILYPLAILSSLSVLVILSAVYTMIVLFATRRENWAVSWQNLFFPVTAGITLAMMQIAVIDLVRYLLTGSWGGLSL